MFLFPGSRSVSGVFFGRTPRLISPWDPLDFRLSLIKGFEVVELEVDRIQSRCGSFEKNGTDQSRQLDDQVAVPSVTAV